MRWIQVNSDDFQPNFSSFRTAELIPVFVSSISNQCRSHQIASPKACGGPVVQVQNAGVNHNYHMINHLATTSFVQFRKKWLCDDGCSSYSCLSAVSSSSYPLAPWKYTGRSVIRYLNSMIVFLLPIKWVGEQYNDVKSTTTTNIQYIYNI